MNECGPHNELFTALNDLHRLKLERAWLQLSIN